MLRAKLMRVCLKVGYWIIRDGFGSKKNRPPGGPGPCDLQPSPSSALERTWTADSAVGLSCTKVWFQCRWLNPWDLWAIRKMLLKEESFEPGKSQTFHVPTITWNLRKILSVVWCSATNSSPKVQQRTPKDCIVWTVIYLFKLLMVSDHRTRSPKHFEKNPDPGRVFQARCLAASTLDADLFWSAMF
jgi:hypothetical protein